MVSPVSLKKDLSVLMYIELADQMAYSQLYAGGDRSNKMVSAIISRDTPKFRTILEQGKEDILDWVDTRTGHTFLHFAVTKGAVEMVDLLLSEGTAAWINAQDVLGNTALHLAVTNCNADATKSLLAHSSVNVSLMNNIRETAFAVASKQSSKGIALVGIFLNFSRSWIVSNFERNVHVLARYNNVEAFKLILEEMSLEGDDHIAETILSKNQWGATIMHDLARLGAHSIIEYLLERCNTFGVAGLNLLSVKSPDQKYPLYYSVEGNHEKSVRCMLQHGADCTLAGGNHSPPVHVACSQDKLAILKVMVDIQGKSILTKKDQNGKTLLHSSVFSICSGSLVSYLIANGLAIDDQDNEGVTPLAQAVLLGNIHGVEVLLKNGANIFIKDRRGYNVLLMAVAARKLEVFRCIILQEEASELVQDANLNGVCPIHLAIKLGMKDMIEPLLKLVEERIYQKDGEGNTYLHLAAISGNVQMLKHILGLLEGKSMLNDPNEEGFTPLHFAAMQPFLPVVQVLLDYGATVHKNDTGCTPFMLACQKGNLESAQALLFNGMFQKNWTDFQGNSALHLAVEGKNPGIITYCLDENISVSANAQGDTFFNLILQAEDQKLAIAALKHNRWMEYLSVTTPGQHTLLSIIDKIPEAYKIVLDQCYVTSGHDKTHEDYWEEYNFVGVNTTLSGNQNSDIILTNSDDGNQVVSLESLKSLESHRQDNVESANAQVHRTTYNPLDIAMKLSGMKYDYFLLHPVFEAFIDSRLRGFGRYYLYSKFICVILLSILSTILTALLPSASNRSSESRNATSCEPDISVGAMVALYSSILVSVLNLFYVIAHIFIHYTSFIRLSQDVLTWSMLISAFSVIIYSVSVLVGLQSSFRLALAIGVCFAWLSVGCGMKVIRFNNIGVYITIVLRTTRSVFGLLIIMLVFIIALSMPLHILASSADVQLSSLGTSLFSTFGNLVGFTSYDSIIALDASGQLQYSIAVFLFLVVIIMVLPIVMINVILGLVLGDIALLQRDATITHVKFEILSLYDVEKLNSILSVFPHLSKTRLRRYPNKKNAFGRLVSYIVRQYQPRVIVQVPESSPSNQFELLMQDQKEINRKMKQLQQSQEVQLQAMERLEMMMKKSADSIQTM